MHSVAALALAAILAAGGAMGDCIDINADDTARLAEIVHIAEARAAADARERLEGVASVVDADTLTVAGARVRLIGIDAPESRQMCRHEEHDWPCGELATQAVAELVYEGPLACDVYGYDRWNRALAVCYQNGRDLNAEIVRRGWALAWYPEAGAVTGPNYGEAQVEAELKAAGIWQGDFRDPWAWRRLAN